MITVYNAGRLEQLASHWLQLRADDQLTALQTESVIVGHEANGDWLRQFLATADTIAANISFELPAAAIWRLMRLIDPQLPPRSALSRQELQLRCYAVLADPDLQLNGFNNQGPEIVRWNRATALADVFDQYLVYRADLLTDWESGKGSGMQAEIWRAIAKHIPAHYHRAQLLAQAISALESSPVRNNLPALRLFNVHGLAPDYLRFIEALARHTQVDILTLNPSTAYWLDQPLNARKFAELEQDPSNDQGNPLLAAWAKSLRDQLRLLMELQRVDHQSLSRQQSAATTLLETLQQSFIDNAATLAPAQNDHSIQLVNCHTPFRELEVLRDYLLSRCATSADLQADDIIVMAPDINQYTAFIPAVFGDSTLPYTIADRAIESELQNLGLFVSLIDPQNPLQSIAAFIAIFDNQEFLSAQGFNADAAQRIKELLTTSHTLIVDPQLGIKSPGTLGHFLSRAVISSLADPNHHAVEGWLLNNQISAEDWPLLTQLLLIVENAEAYTASCKQSASLRQWIERWNQRWAQCFGDSAEAALERPYIDNAQQTLLDAALAAGHGNGLIDAQVAYAMLLDALDQSRFGRQFLNGDITFCSLLPMRSIPHRVVCVLGLNDAEFPRIKSPQDFDLIAENPRLGDRSQRHDDRQLFLEALLAARETFYMSYVGRSASTKDEFPPSILINELRTFLRHSGHVIAAYPASLHNFDQQLSAYPWAAVEIDKKPKPPTLKNNPEPVRIADFERVIDYFSNPAKSYLRAQGFALPFHPQEIRKEPLEKAFATRQAALIEQIHPLPQHCQHGLMIDSGDLGFGISAQRGAETIEQALPSFTQYYKATPTRLNVEYIIEDRVFALQLWVSDNQLQFISTQKPEPGNQKVFVQWLKQLLANAAGQPITSLLFCLNEAKWYHCPAIQQAQAANRFAALLSIADQGYNSALPLFAKSSAFLLKKPEATPQRWRNSGQFNYDDGEYDANLAIQLLFEPEIIQSEQAAALANAVYDGFFEQWALYEDA